ncbi:uncharacterized protein KGF55_004377 [Candida pseudojiufengensis]|uniref:uncharacterized protein n=1 Tax=Candida pseudojiufengensis TaxID=497109 RepID=UPI002223EEEB|nr:uncharacterized protein KGF55_004377 [Candida pseudojiufengensis]KAI5960807.1 hypothetical protein KGF55_004377 [Candida pseudojiufengensis]
MTNNTISSTNGENKVENFNVPHENQNNTLNPSNLGYINTSSTFDSDELHDPKEFEGIDLERDAAFAPRLEVDYAPNVDYVPIGGDELSLHESDAVLSRELSRRITNTNSLLHKKNYQDEDLTMGFEKEFPPMLPDRTPYCVSYNGANDPLHPHNYSLSKKIIFSIPIAISSLSVSLGSALFSQGAKQVSEIYHVGSVVTALGTSLFVFGFAAGPVVYGPLSELFGRRMVMIVSNFGFVCFSFAVATAKDIQTIMICRFFAGCIGSAPFVVGPAILVDLYPARVRGMVIGGLVSILFSAPALAPVIGGFIAINEHMGYRWLSYISALVGCLALLSTVILLEETHHPVILVRKAEILRRKTGNWGIFAPHEEISLSLKEIFQNNILRPLKLLFTEPIIFIVSIYNAFVYGILYALLTAIPLIFEGRYGWKQGVAELPYLSLLIGILSAGVIIVYFEIHSNKKADAAGLGGKVIPENRCLPMMIGAFTFVIGVFWMGWTGDFPDKIHFMVPIIGLSFVGNGLILIFLPSMNYILDCYLYVAASALAGNTFIRSAVGGIFPIVIKQMYTNLTIKWASTLIGCFGLIMIPFPFLFYKYGNRIRAKSKFALK